MNTTIKYNKSLPTLADGHIIRTNDELDAANLKVLETNYDRPGLVAEGQNRNAQRLNYWRSLNWQTQFLINDCYDPENLLKGIEQSASLDDYLRIHGITP